MRYGKTACTLLFAATAFAFLSEGAEAQRRGRSIRRYNVRPHGSVYGYYYTAYPGFYHGPFYAPAYYHPPYRAHYGPSYVGGSSLRVQVKPVDTEIYVDGYFAGVVDDFDGFFQRLRLPPGEHEIELFLEGHRSVRKTLYLSPGSTYKIRTEMQPLDPGESEEPRPGPAEPPARVSPEDAVASVTSERGERRGEEPLPSSIESPFGVLALKIQPNGAALLIDGEAWPVAEGWEQLIIHLPAGRHRVELQKDGYTSFGVDVDLRPARRTDLNVRLTPGDAPGDSPLRDIQR